MKRLVTFSYQETNSGLQENYTIRCIVMWEFGKSNTNSSTCHTLSPSSSFSFCLARGSFARAMLSFGLSGPIRMRIVLTQISLHTYYSTQLQFGQFYMFCENSWKFCKFYISASPRVIPREACQAKINCD